MNILQWFWIVWASAALAVEVYALTHRVPMGTLSEQLWYLRDNHRGYFSLICFVLAWAIYHFWMEGK